MKLKDGTIVEHAWTDWYEIPITKHRQVLKLFGLHIYADPTNFANSHIISNRKLTQKEVRKFAKEII